MILSVYIIQVPGADRHYVQTTPPRKSAIDAQPKGTRVYVVDVVLPVPQDVALAEKLATKVGRIYIPEEDL